MCEARERYARKREILLPVLERKGLRDAGGADHDVPLAGAAGRARPRSRSRCGCSSTGSWSRPERYLGPSGEGYVRFALVPTEDGVRGRRRDPGGGAVTDVERLEQTIERLWEPSRGGSGARGRARSRRRSSCSTRARARQPRSRAASWARERVGEEGDPPLLPPAAVGADRGRAVPVLRQGSP